MGASVLKSDSSPSLLKRQRNAMSMEMGGCGGHTHLLPRLAYIISHNLLLFQYIQLSLALHANEKILDSGIYSIIETLRLDISCYGPSDGGLKRSTAFFVPILPERLLP